MNPKKPEKSVSNMDILKDIRGLLSTTPSHEVRTEVASKDERGLKPEASRLKEEIKRYQELVQKQQDELDKLRNENKKLTDKSTAPISNEGKPVSPGTDLEADQLEARKAELTSALSQIEGLLQFKTQELLKRIARVYQEAGQGDLAIEIRRTGNELEDTENLARFVQALLG